MHSGYWAGKTMITTIFARLFKEVLCVSEVIAGRNGIFWRRITRFALYGMTRVPVPFSPSLCAWDPDEGTYWTNWTHL